MRNAWQVGGQAVLGRQGWTTTPWLTERHGYDPTYIAQEIGCDHRAISAAISTQAGINFHQLIGKIRSNEVAQRLVDPKFSDYTVEEIGLHCGFSSRQSFYNAFHRSFNMTPRQYRLQHLSKS